jgi:hypothetical protein
MAKKPSAEDYIKALVALFGAGAAGVGGGLGGYGGGAARGASGGAAAILSGGAGENLSHNFNYDLNYIPGPAQNNGMLQQAMATMYGYRQTPEEHAAALRRGNESELTQWWDDDRPRANFTPSSSAVSGIRITPKGIIQIRFGRGNKWYSYRGGPTPNAAAVEAMKLIGTNGQSIGRNLLRKSSKYGQWARDHCLPGY